MQRWTCPRCAPGTHTFVANGSAGDTAAAIRAAQERHRDLHRKEAITLARLGLHEDHPADSRRSA